MERDEALLALTLRYFSTRGPATPHDMAMWSGLTLANVRRGIEIAGSSLESRSIDDRIFWFTPAPPAAITTGAYLLPNYDEYFIGFKDRSAIGERIRRSGATIAPEALSHHIVIIDGQIVGGWRRTLEANRVTVELNPVVAWTKPEERAISSAAEKYGAFLGLPVTLTRATGDGFGRSPGSLPIHSLFDVTTR